MLIPVYLALLAASGAAAAGGTHSVIDLPCLLHEMVDRDALARLPSPTYVTHQASSYDRRSKTPDDPEGWFANDDTSQFIRSEMHDGRREWVMMDADGPGVVTRIWWGGMDPPPNRLVRIYLDGSSAPVIAVPALDLLTGAALAPHPLSIVNGSGPPGAHGGMNLFFPIPYARHCKITWDDVNPHNPADPPESRWYNIEYRTYAPGVRVKSFTWEDRKAVDGLTGEVCRQLLHAAPPATTQSVSASGEIPPGGEQTLELPAGPAAVRRLLVKAPAPPDRREVAEELRGLVMRMQCDGEETIWCPVSDFFGSGLGLNPLQNWDRSVNADGTLECYWTMPYRQSASVSLMNEGDSSVTVTLEAGVGDWKWDDRSMHFHSSWRRDSHIPTRPFSDWNYVTVDGDGLYVGDTLTVFNPVQEWWGEGDEKIWVDGDTFPSHFGTGSEDYYGYSYGSTELFQGPFSSQVRCDGPGNKGHTVVTRTRCLDAIPFTRRLKFDMEIWHWADTHVDYAVATYWYARPGARCNAPSEPRALMP